MVSATICVEKAVDGLCFLVCFDIKQKKQNYDSPAFNEGCVYVRDDTKRPDQYFPSSEI